MVGLRTDRNQPRSVMPVQRLNHAVLYVRDVERSVAFYTDLLNFRTVFRVHADGGKVPEGAFLQAAESTNDHDLAFLQVDTLAELRQIRGKLVETGTLADEIDHGTTKSL